MELLLHLNREFNPEMAILSYANISDKFKPTYDPTKLGAGIVHIGLGAFHKAHQAALTHKVLQKQPDNWRIFGVSLRSSKPSSELTPQDCLYTLIEKGMSGQRFNVIGSIAGAACLGDNFDGVLSHLISEDIKIVSITVTEKAYGLDRANKGCDIAHPAIAHDLENVESPKGVVGLLVLALKLRRKNGTEPFTVLCCDNLPENGVMVRNAVVDFARRIDQELAAWIKHNVAFPSTMVDRITPAATSETMQEAEQEIGLSDNAAVETEEFCQWVIEDNFPTGRPNWDIAGAIFTDDVAKFEMMKLRMLNGAHSMLAYVGFHCGYKYVRDVMQNEPMVQLIRRHMRSAQTTLDELEGVDFNLYAQDLIDRFRNPSIAHETFQIAMDGSEKMPQRVFAPAVSDKLNRAQRRPFVFATAAWLRHVSGSQHDCSSYILRDPAVDKLKQLDLNCSTKDLVRQLMEFNIIPQFLAGDDLFWEDTNLLLKDMLSNSMIDIVYKESDMIGS